MVFYCEQAARFCSDIGNEDESYFAALVGVFNSGEPLATRCARESRLAFVWGGS
jgi:hypothetical protein